MASKAYDAVQAACRDADERAHVNSLALRLGLSDDAPEWAYVGLDLLRRDAMADLPDRFDAALRALIPEVAYVVARDAGPAVAAALGSEIQNRVDLQHEAAMTAHESARAQVLSVAMHARWSVTVTGIWSPIATCIVAACLLVSLLAGPQLAAKAGYVLGERAGAERGRRLQFAADVKMAREAPQHWQSLVTRKP